MDSIFDEGVNCEIKTNRCQKLAIFGSPGTGKTRALTGLIRMETSDPANQGKRIGVLSFSKAAALEIMHRISNENISFVGTIHSLCFQSIGLSKDQVFSSEFFPDIYQDPEELSKAVSIRSVAMHRNCTISEIIERHRISGFNTFTTKRVVELCRLYDQFKTENAYFDFDDMLISQRLKIEPFDILFVDEAQDLSAIHWDIINKITKGSIYVAGDDDQSIYGWNGASVKHFLDFAAGNDVKILKESYRLSQTMLQFSARVIRNIAPGYRMAKEVKSVSKREGNIIAFGSFTSAIQEAMEIGDDVTILCRTKRQIAEIRNKLKAMGIKSYTLGTRMPLIEKIATIILAIINEDFDTVRRHKGILSEKSFDLVKDGKFPDLDLNDPFKIFDVIKFAQKGIDYVMISDLNILMYELQLSLTSKPVATVILSTIHQFKGRESPTVILLGECPDRCLNVARHPDMRNEEIRVWYTGLTRAYNNLFVVGFNPYLEGII
jgi:superfamily I DNA/RNA helicase